MEIEFGLNPNCSEAVFRVDDIEFSVDTAAYPNGFVDELISNKENIDLSGVEIEDLESKVMARRIKEDDIPYEVIKEMEDKGLYEPLENLGGGAHFSYIEKTLVAFLLYKRGMIDEERLRDWDRETW